MDTSSRKIIETKGIVLSDQKYGETSKIVTLFTEKLGKISIMAKGALNIRSNMLALTQVFTVANFKLVPGRNFYYINDASIISSNFDLRKSLDRLVYGNYFLEIVSKTTFENEANIKIYMLLEKVLYNLKSRDSNYTLLALAFELKYISIIGYRPNLTGCVNCGNNNFDNVYFSTELGGLLCGNCTEYGLDLVKLSEENIYYLNKILYTSLDNMDKFQIEVSEIAFLQNLVHEYIKNKTEINKFFSLNLL